MSSAIIAASAATHPEAPISHEVSLNPALAAVICAALLYAVAWVAGCGGSDSTTQNHAGGKKVAASRSQIPLAPQDANDKLVQTNSGRRLTIEKMAQRATTS